MSKFDTIIESYMSRYNSNTLVMGDQVKFIENILRHEWMTAQPELKQEKLKDLIESGDIIRITAVKTSKPHTVESGHFEVVDDIYYDIVREAAPGLYLQVFTIPAYLVEFVGSVSGDNFPEIPDSKVRSDTSQIKPSEVDIPDNEFSPIKQTGMDQGDRKLLGQNIDISVSTPAKSYTSKYMT